MTVKNNAKIIMTKTEKFLEWYRIFFVDLHMFVFH